MFFFLITKFISNFAKNLSDGMNNLIRFLQKYYYIFLFLILEGFAVYFISCNSFYQGSAITSFANSVAGGVYGGVDAVSKYFSLASVNEELVKENARLREQIESSYVRYTDRVMIKDDTIYKQQFSFVEAKVISKSINKRNNYFMLNKGLSSGILKDMSVIAPNGIVGVVVNSTENFSLVMTVLHQDSKIAVKNKRTGASGTLVWNGGNYATGQVIDIPSSMPIKVGDTITTSGFSRNFPEGIEVGYIKKFSKDSGSGFYNVEIKYSTDYNKLGYVYVVKNFFKLEQEQLERGIKEDE